jgi:hypothetical protein
MLALPPGHAGSNSTVFRANLLKSQSGRAREVLSFCVLASALLAFLFRDAWLHGYVLGQADFLFDYLPWQSYRPTGWRVRNPLMGDPPMVFFPFIFHARAEILRGHFPLWTSAIGGGQPFFGAMQTAVLSPFTLLDYILPFPASFTADVAARLAAGGLGMYLFLRRLPVCRGAAVFGGIAYLLNPFSIVWLEHPLSAVAAWLPWILLTVDACATRSDRQSAAALALVTALMLFTGHPETAFKVLLLAGPYAVYRGWVHGTTIRSTMLVAVAMLVGALVASVQLLPFLEYASGSRILAVRSAASTPLFTDSAVSFVTAFVPDFYGTPIRRDFVIDGNYCEQQIYSSLVAWVLAAIAVTHRQHRGRAIFFLSAGAVAALIMYGTPVARAATLLIPPLRVAALSRFGLIAIAGVAITAAIGLDALLADEGSPSRQRSMRLAAVGTVAAASIAVLVVGYLIAQRPLLVRAHHWSLTLRSTMQASAFLFAAVGLLYLEPRIRRTTAISLFTTLLAVDLLVFADGFHPLMPRQHVFPPMKETTLLQADPSVFRVVGWMDILLPNTALVYGLRDVRSYDGVGVREYADLLDVGFHYTGGTHQLVNTATPRLIDLLNIKYILTSPEMNLPADRFQLLMDGPTRVYLNQRVQPRAFLVDGQVNLRGNDARRAMRDTIDLTRVAVLDSPLDVALQPDRAAGDVGTATLHRYQDERVSIMTRADGRRLLVLTDVHYPGWIATVDGVEVPILRADYAFRAVSVPAGEHLVEFRYRPASVRYGAWGSLAGLVILSLLLVPRLARPQTAASTAEVP